MIDVSEVVLDPDLCEPFSIVRTTGQFAAGGWETDPSVTIAAYGAVRNASQKDIDQTPEADRVSQMISIRSVTPMYVTSEAQGQTSDVIVWHGDQFRLTSVKDYSAQGYYYAVASRMAGN